ncbi:MAG: NAD-dependent epimerase/dehydratase family protein [Endomicrobium sp.]|jgi:ADP-L-glycero-D-manno-heptose 6-epimerase|nr:NAD-dependent epimerase/dehydratase family protein [Endomicrobium sp.]
MIISTGEAGVVSSCFFWKLNREDIKDIFVVNHLNDSKKQKILTGKNFYDYIQKTDFFDAIINRQLPKLQAIVHFNAYSFTTFFNADYYTKNNYEYSKVLFLRTFELGISFIYASSAETHGDEKYDCSDDISKIKSLSPLNIYGSSKYIFDS